MSNIYIQEPPTSGKVLLKTSVGDIDIELWARECPKACRNFIQLCLEGYYDGTIFHRLVKGFIVQGGDRDGSGGESIFGGPFKDEFHSRLRYTRRGLMGMANSGKDDNTSQFFFTFAATPELQSKNTLFGKVTGDTIYNMLKLEEGMVDHQERPMYTHRIISTEVLSNPFDDIKPRSIFKTDQKNEKKKKKQKQGVKNFGLLSFGEEAAGDEQETTSYVKQNAGKAKSLHDVADDPKLSKEPIVVPKSEKVENDDYLTDDCQNDTKTATEINFSEIIRKKLAKTKASKSKTVAATKTEVNVDTDSEEDALMTREQEQKLKISQEKEKIREEIISLKKQYQMEKLNNEKKYEVENGPKDSQKEIDITKASDNHYIKEFIQSKEKYSEKTKNKLKGQVREEFTLSLLSKFRSKLDNLKQNTNAEESESNDKPCDDGTVEKEICGDQWLSHTLNFNSTAPVLAKDASTKSDDWYDVYDPRNPLNKRKRAENSHSSSKTRHSKRNA